MLYLITAFLLAQRINGFAFTSCFATLDVGPHGYPLEGMAQFYTKGTMETSAQCRQACHHYDYPYAYWRQQNAGGFAVPCWCSDLSPGVAFVVRPSGFGGCENQHWEGSYMKTAYKFDNCYNADVLTSIAGYFAITNSPDECFAYCTHNPTALIWPQVDGNQPWLCACGDESLQGGQETQCAGNGEVVYRYTRPRDKRSLEGRRQ